MAPWKQRRARWEIRSRSGAPVAPVAPVGAPFHPCFRFAPVYCCTRGGIVATRRPVAPVDPVAPVPVAPVAPVEPGLPGPCGPVAPVHLLLRYSLSHRGAVAPSSQSLRSIRLEPVAGCLGTVGAGIHPLPSGFPTVDSYRLSPPDGACCTRRSVAACRSGRGLSRGWTCGARCPSASVALWQPVAKTCAASCSGVAVAPDNRCSGGTVSGIACRPVAPVAPVEPVARCCRLRQCRLLTGITCATVVACGHLSSVAPVDPVHLWPRLLLWSPSPCAAGCAGVGM